jgi:S-adenosylmethionine hydrolase
VRISAPADATGGTTRVATRTTSFADVAAGAVGLVIDSNGMLAIVMNQRSAASELRIDDGDQIVISPLDEDAAPSDDASPVSVELTSR